MRLCCHNINKMTVNNILFCNLLKFSKFHKPSLFFTCSLNLSAYLTDKYRAREGKTFNKLLGYNNKKKKYCVGSFIPETPVLSGSGSKKIKGGKDSSRRKAVLNKLFMTHITELMATGHAANYISGLSIEIARVSICSTFTQLNVYWLAQGTENDQLIEDRLLNISASLRHELSQLRVMGEVPRIVFCKDKYYRKFTEVEELLKVADYGDEYEPLTTGARLKNNNSATFEEGQSKEMPEEELPEMSQRALNLDHAYILEKIQKGVEKSKAVHRQLPGYVPEISEGLKGETSTITNLFSAKERKEGLENFLLKRKIAREKNIKKQRRFVPEIVLNSKYDDDDDYLDELDKFIKDRDYLEEEKEDR